LGGFFVSDDFQMLHRASTAGNWIEASHLPYTDEMSWFRPVSQWSWWIQWKMGGLEPLVYRLANVGLHGLNAVLVAWLTGVLVAGAGSVRGGAAAGVAFALAPIHPEAVTWLSGRTDVLCCSGLLVSLLAWTRFCCADGRWWHLALAGLGLCFSLGAKEMGCVIPVLGGLIWLRDALDRPGRVRLGDAPLLRRRLQGLAILSVLVAGYFALRFQVLGGLGGVSVEGENIHDSFDVLYALRFVARALVFAFSPLHSQFHPAPLHLLRVLPAVGVAALALLAVLRAPRRGVLLGALLALALFVVSTAPIAGWGHVSGTDFQSTRYLYIPTVFSSLLLGMLVASVGSRHDRHALVAGALIIAPWTYQLFEVNGAWRRAADTAERAMVTLPRPGEAKHLLVTDLPDNHNGAFVLRVAFSLGAQMFSKREGIVREVERDEWEAMRIEGLARGVRPAVYIRWDNESGWLNEP
jgi:hypothetical protein